MKIVTVVGARPQFVKVAPVSKELRKYFNEVLIHTGQHYDASMSDVFFEELNIPKPDYNLCIGSGNHGEQTAKMLIEIEKILINEKPDMVLLYGDTNSTLAGALAAVKLHIPIAHIEAGPRDNDLNMPEEVNRKCTDHCSSILFCCTKNSYENLVKENLANNAFLTGDVMLDAVLQNIEIAKKKSSIIEKFNLSNVEYILATIHRPSNTDDEKNLKNIVKALIDSGKKIVFPIHPRTQKQLEVLGLYDVIVNNENIIKLDPVGYLDMINLEYNAQKIVTDSGGVQREAYFLKKPCICLYDHSPWVETVEEGWNYITNVEYDKILYGINEFIPKHSHKNSFGDGMASMKIVNEIKKFLKVN